VLKGGVRMEEENHIRYRKGRETNLRRMKKVIYLCPLEWTRRRVLQSQAGMENIHLHKALTKAVELGYIEKKEFNNAKFNTKLTQNSRTGRVKRNYYRLLQ
jgi:hypothetical protein